MAYNRYRCNSKKYIHIVPYNQCVLVRYGPDRGEGSYKKGFSSENSNQEIIPVRVWETRRDGDEEEIGLQNNPLFGSKRHNLSSKHTDMFLLEVEVH